MKFIKKSVSILLIITMIVSLFTIIPFEVGAAGGVQYIERSWDSSDKKVIETVKTCTDYTDLANRSSDHLEGWYVVSYNMTINSRLYVNASHPDNIILCDGATLTCPKGFEIARRAALSIYGQSGGSGQIVTKPNKEEDSPGNSHALIEVGGRFNVYGGTLDVECGTRLTSLRGAAIGGAINRTPGTISIYGGTVNAKTHFRGAAIGGGYYDEAGTIRIYGGTVTAEGSDAGAIGNGLEGDSDGSIEIYGGTVTAKSNNFSAAIGGADGTDGPAVTISGGTVKATNDHGPGSGAAIGSGRGANRTNPSRITGGTVTALSTDSAAIGAGYEASA